MATVFHARPHGKFIEIKSNLRRKKRHVANQDPNFLVGSFSSRDKVRVPIQFRKGRQSQHLQRLFFLKNRPIHFLIKSTWVIRLIKLFRWNKLSCSSMEVNKPLFALFKVSRILAGSLEANSSCSYKLNAWSRIE